MNKCPTVESGQAGKADSCKGCPNASKCASAKPDSDIPIIKKNIENLKMIIAVLSGKGGVGKSTISCNIARYLADTGIKTLILDFDLSGPSIPRLTNTTEEFIIPQDNVINPVKVNNNLFAVSVGHLEGFEEKQHVFNTQSKNFTIKNMLKNINLSNIEVMIVDTPPNITEEHLALSNYIKPLYGIMVTTPQKLAFDDVIRQLSFCRKIGMDVIGLIENMKGFVCGDCGHVNKLFKEAGVNEFCKIEEIKYLGSIALKKSISKDSDSGVKANDPIFMEINNIILNMLEGRR